MEGLSGSQLQLSEILSLAVRKLSELEVEVTLHLPGAFGLSGAWGYSLRGLGCLLYFFLLCLLLMQLLKFAGFKFRVGSVECSGGGKFKSRAQSLCGRAGVDFLVGFLFCLWFVFTSSSVCSC